MTIEELQKKASDNILSEQGQIGFIVGYLYAKKKYSKLPLPDDAEVIKWFDENIGNDNEKPCSASSAIYKFRVWLSERE